MNLSIPTFLALAPMISSATLIEDAISRIEGSYDPKIEIQWIGSERSFYGCSIEKLLVIGKDPVSLEPREVHVDFYRSKKSRRKAIVILPPTGGVNILDRGYANELCASGIDAVLVSGWGHQNEMSLDYDMHNKAALRSLVATRHVVELLKSKNFDKIGILGTSIGAVASSLVLSFEPRITSAALIVGSSRFVDVIAESDEAGASTLRKERMKAYGFKSLEEYKLALKKNIWIEPHDYIHRIGENRCLIVSADSDSTIPTKYQFELADQIRAEQHIQLKGDHLQVIKETFFCHRGEIVNFFLKVMADE